MITLRPLYDTTLESIFMAAALRGFPGAAGSTFESPQNVLQLT